MQRSPKGAGDGPFAIWHPEPGSSRFSGMRDIMFSIQYFYYGVLLGPEIRYMPGVEYIVVREVTFINLEAEATPSFGKAVRSSSMTGGSGTFFEQNWAQ
jgi:hypothetical protein